MQGAHLGKRAHRRAPLRRLNHWVVNPNLMVLYIDEYTSRVAIAPIQGTPAPGCES